MCQTAFVSGEGREEYAASADSTRGTSVPMSVDGGSVLIATESPASELPDEEFPLDEFPEEVPEQEIPEAPFSNTYYLSVVPK